MNLNAWFIVNFCTLSILTVGVTLKKYLSLTTADTFNFCDPGEGTVAVLELHMSWVYVRVSVPSDIVVAASSKSNDWNPASDKE